jgi:outer membrane protein TolC
MGIPQVSGSFAMNWNYSVPKIFIPANVFDPTAPEGKVIAREFSPKFGGQTGVGLQWLMLDGTYFLGLAAAKTFTEISEKQITMSKIDIAENVSKAYYTLLIMNERKKTLTENKLRLDTLLSQTQALFDNGLAEKLDVDRLRVTHNNMSVEIDKLESATRSVMQMLKFQMSMPLDADLSIAGNIHDLKFSPETPEVEPSQRIEFQLLTVQRKLEQMDIKRYQVGYLPSLVFSTNLGANSGTAKLADLFNFGDRWFRNGSMGVQLNVPIFDGFRKKYQIQQARLALIKTENNMRNFVMAATFQAEQASITLNNHLKSLETQKANMDLAKEVFRVAQIKYREGVGSSLEMINAENELIRAELNYFETLYNAAITKVELDKAKGKLFNGQ